MSTNISFSTNEFLALCQSFNGTIKPERLNVQHLKVHFDDMFEFDEIIGFNQVENEVNIRELVEKTRSISDEDLIELCSKCFDFWESEQYKEFGFIRASFFVPLVIES